MNPYPFQFEVGTTRGEGRRTSYTLDGKPYLIGFKNGKPVYNREFGLHFFTRRMKREGCVKTVPQKAQAANA